MTSTRRNNVQRTRGVLSWLTMLLLGALLFGGGGTGVAQAQQSTATPTPTPSPTATRAPGDYRNHAGLVVRFGNGDGVTECVDLGADGWATGEEVLRTADVDEDIVTEAGQGSDVCQIEQEGCNTDAAEGATQPCYCAYDFDSGGNRWHYFRLVDGAWSRSDRVSESFYNNVVEPRDVEGWLWGSDTTSMGAVIPFNEICVAATPTATPTASATPTRTPTRTNTPTVTDTSAPTATDTPQALTPAPTRRPIDLQQEAPAPRATATGDPDVTPTRRPTRTPRPTRPIRASDTPTSAPTRTPAPTAVPAPTEPAPTSTPLPAAAPAPTAPPPPTNTLVPTVPPAPTQPPAPTLPPPPTATTEPPSPTVDRTATRVAVLETELAIAPPTATAATAVAAVLDTTPTADRTALAVVQQAQATAQRFDAQPQRPATTGSAEAAPDETVIIAGTEAGAPGMGIWYYLVFGAIIIVFVAVVAVLLVMQRHAAHTEEDM